MKAGALGFALSLLLATTAHAEGPDTLQPDLRWRGVALEDLPGAEVALVNEAVRLANPGRLDEVESVAWLERTVVNERDSDVTAGEISRPRYLVQIVGRAARFASDMDQGPRKKAPLGVVVVEARLAADTSDLPELSIVREAALATLDLEIKASLIDRLTLVMDERFGFIRVWPVGVGALDTVRRPGELSSLTPATELGRISREVGFLSLSAPAWNRGMPYLPFEIPMTSTRSIKPRRWYVETRVAFHAFQGQKFSRGFNSHGCITLRDADLIELADLVFARPVPLPLAIQPAPFMQHQHPFPHETGHYWELENLGTAKNPRILRGNLYAIKKVKGTPPLREMVAIYMDWEKRRERLGPVLAQHSPIPAVLTP